MNKKFREEFELHLSNMAGGYNALTDPKVPLNVKLKRIEEAKESYEVCKEYFHDDADNLHRWYFGSKCVFITPITDCSVEVAIHDIDHLFDFLCFCKKQNTHEYDEEYFEYLGHLTLYREND